MAGDGGGLVFEGAVGELVFEGPHVVADIEDAGAVAVGLGDEDAALFVEVEGDGVGEHGLGGPEGGDEAGRELHALERLLALVGGGSDLGRGDARAHFEDLAGGAFGAGGSVVVLGGGFSGAERKRGGEGEGRREGGGAEREGTAHGKGGR